MGSVGLVDTCLPCSSRNTPLPFWQHCGSLLQQRLPSAQDVTRGKAPFVSFSSGVASARRDRVSSRL